MCPPHSGLKRAAAEAEGGEGQEYLYSNARGKKGGNSGFRPAMGEYPASFDKGPEEKGAIRFF